MILPLIAEAYALAAEANFVPHETTVLDRGISLLGLAVLVSIGVAMSENRGAISWRTVLWGLGLQLLFGLVMLNESVSGVFYYVVNTGVDRLLGFAGDGASFVFQSVEPHLVLGPDGNPIAGADGVPKVFAGVANGISPPVKTFAFWVLPTIIFFSSLMSVLYHLGVMQVVVKAIAWLMIRTLGTSGAESLSAAGNIFVGQTEAPLLVRPFVDKMTRSELMAVMVGGFATVAGGVLGAYVAFLQAIPNIAGHLVIASIISAPAALAMAKLFVPETEESVTAGELKVELKSEASNFVEAAANGAADGMKLALNVAAMLIAIVALVAMANWLLSLVPIGFCDSGVVLGYTCQAATDTAPAVGAGPLDLARILGWVFAPIAFIMGVPWGEIGVVGRLLGEKIVLTEFIAYINLAGLISSETAVISERSAVIASYALCGFANFASIGIQLGGIGGIAPKRMGDLAAMGFKAMVAGALAACMTGCIAGLMI